jgi:hypothetical protein
MRTQSADERRIWLIVQDEIMREYAHSRGPKRDIDKITRILTLISRNDRCYSHFCTKDIIHALPDINENDLEDYLAFLTKFPKSKPFLLAKRCESEGGMDARKKAGAPPNEYSFDFEWLIDARFLPYSVDAALMGTNSSSYLMDTIIDPINEKTRPPSINDLED